MSATNTEYEAQMARRLMKKQLSRLTSVEGNGTSLVSLCIASGSQIILTQKMLTTELGTATNIKSRVNRQSVITAIKSAQHKLKMYKETPENGLALFCGMVIDPEGKEKMWSEVIEPPKPLTRGLYMCDSRFHTNLLEDMLHDAPLYGFIVIDGNGCLFATIQGDQKNIIGKFSVDLPKKHGRGGQSAQRFGRIRLEKRQAYLKKCCEMAVTHFITDDKCNVKGLIMAGSAEFKDVISWGAGPRASQYLILAAKTKSVLEGRFTPSIDDVKYSLVPVLRHRIIPSFNAEAEGINSVEIIKRISEKI